MSQNIIINSLINLNSTKLNDDGDFELSTLKWDVQKLRYEIVSI